MRTSFGRGELTSFPFPAIVLFVAIFSTQQLGAEEPSNWVSHPTAGVIASVPAPNGWFFAYDPYADSIALVSPDDRSILIFVSGPRDPETALGLLLLEFGKDPLGTIVQVEIAGYSGVAYRGTMENGGTEWYVIVPRDGLLIVLWGKTRGTLSDIEATTRRVLSGLTLSRSELPERFTGTWDTGSVEPGIELRDDGTARWGTYLTYDQDILGSGLVALPRWQVRGNRLLLFSPDGGFASLLIGTTEGNPQLFDATGERLPWRRMDSPRQR